MPQCEDLKKFLRNLKVFPNKMSKAKKITDIVKNADDYRFNKDGEYISIRVSWVLGIVDEANVNVGALQAGVQHLAPVPRYHLRPGWRERAEADCLPCRALYGEAGPALQARTPSGCDARDAETWRHEA